MLYQFEHPCHFLDKGIRNSLFFRHLVLVQRQPTRGLGEGKGQVSTGERLNRSSRRRWIGDSIRQLFVQRIQRALIHLNDQVVKVAKHHVQATDRITDVSGDLTSAQSGQTVFAHQPLGCLQGDFA